ncbi:hypothetical protein J14TS2_03760 [Bacillus sp. J14TS2]|uniref:hypothetical protein n=1 Tax=Bacillus sp. J14TS2 TaxID=2807188 RepID=UPI001B00F5FD|nr:hypothetical protein [Bacillus sp. J14TS2]GIN69901.1 hypothetical protein J14TS2_03760 [Bacillus sp. J14TS2]
MKYPKWLQNWVDFNEVPCTVCITEEERAGQQIVLVEAKWEQPSQEVQHIQIDMVVNDPRINCVWKPHLSPEKNMVIGDYVFRSPAIIFEKLDKRFALIPDIDFLDTQRGTPHIMDFVQSDRMLTYGLGHYEKTKHVYHTRIDQPIKVEEDQLLFRFYLIEWEEEEEGKRNVQPVVDFIWEKFGEKRMRQKDGEFDRLQELEVFVKHTYDWAFKRWEKIVWQEFTINQTKVGGCVFIVRATQSPGLGQEENWRERKSLWNQAWFSSLRSAYGYRIWGEKWHNQEMIQKAEKAKNFALAAPQTDGLFPSVYWADENGSFVHGVWGHSDRKPESHDHYGHLLDMSWTCLWMLKWYSDIEKDPKLLIYTKRYVERLLTLQNPDGSFPAWVHEETGSISPYLIDSPETSMHVWLLTNLYRISREDKYLRAAKKGMTFVVEQVLPEGRWEDFELYWSCARQWDGKRYGEKDPRSGIYNQCSFSIYWTAEALKELYKVTNEQRYLQVGENVLAELSLYQAIWNPKYLDIPMLGGFGVMTSDDEWNDARQSLFALTYLDYYELTGKRAYQLRGIWAMRASFYLMYCPENPHVMKQYEQTFPHFGEQDYGFEMENAHHGENDQFQPGEFTIFDWGNGSASASLAEILR